MRKCKDCGVDIRDRGNRATRCESCQKIFRYIAFHASGLGRANKRYYQLWKFLNEGKFSREELQILFKKRRTECKYADFETRKILKTEMLIISQAERRVTQNER